MVRISVNHRQSYDRVSLSPAFGTINENEADPVYPGSVFFIFKLDANIIFCFEN